ncbi:MAG: hypothetical protein EKK48_23955 [Candidatus Melainabacteria bacterium]|nr:MAG: hypothetical protein EKK48_23955 [Candidatus Melainabacteria bacterium]
MYHSHQKLEKNIRSEADKSTSDVAQLEVERERRKNGSTRKLAEKSLKPSVDLPALTIDDASSSSFEELKENGNRVLHWSAANGAGSEIEFNEQNQPVRYRSFENEEFINSEPGNPQGVWKSSNNKMQREGVLLNFDSSANSVQMTDLYTKNVVVLTANGVETTTYPPSNGQTMRKAAGNEEWITTHDANGTVRELYVIDNKLQRYTDDQKITYTLSTDTIKRETKNDGADSQSPLTVVPVYHAVGPNGEAIPGRFTITANRTGNVMVRNEDCPGEADCCRRVRVDGAVVTSNGDGSFRTFRSKDGVEIQSKLTSQTGDMKFVDKVIRYPDGTLVEATMADGVASHYIKKTGPDGQVQQYHQEIGRDELLYWVDQDGTQVGDVSGLADTRELEDAPKAIQKTPRDIQLKEMLDQCDKNRVYSFDTLGSWSDNGKLFYEKVNYGGVWDVKSPATRTITDQNQELIVKDQLGRPEYEDYGNWLFGVMGHEVGFPSYVLQQEAGAAQIKQGTSRIEWGAPGIGPRGARLPWTGAGTYGDDPHDNELIQLGYSDAAQVEQEVRKAS